MSTQKIIKVQVITWNEFMNGTRKEGWIEFIDFFGYSFYGVAYKKTSIYLMGTLNNKYETILNL